MAPAVQGGDVTPAGMSGAGAAPAIFPREGIPLFSEPCPFEEYEQTKRVTDALTIPVAGGEQDTSLPRFAWIDTAMNPPDAAVLSFSRACFAPSS